MNKLGRYDILRVLGKGAMGLVYEARDPNLDRRVAIKTIKVENLSEEASAEYEARFRTEARSAARLQHPNIVSVYDSDRHGDIAYLVMEFVQGDDLKRYLDNGTRYSLEQSLSMVLDLLSALDYAHRQNVVHRDIKPANLLVEANGRIKLTDFGVARIQDSGEATRTRGSMVGTLKYMSPEQVQGLPIDTRSDLFAVGVVLYQLLTGKRPFDGDSDFAIIQQVVSYHPPEPSAFNAQLPPALDAVVARALAKPREQRFATAYEFASALQEACAHVLDRSIVPPPGSQGSGTGSNTGAGTGPQRSRTFGSTANLGTLGSGTGSTVTQELELVYWKDIRDSGDREDLEGFLQRFPMGVYADLARRRLKKMPGPGSDTDNEATQMDVTTVSTGPAPLVAQPQDGSDPTAEQTTALAPQPAPVTAAEPLPQPGAQPAPSPVETGISETAAAEAATKAEPAQPAKDLPRAAPQADAPAPAPRAGVPVLAIAAAALLLLGGLAYWWSSGSAPAGAPQTAALPQPAASGVAVSTAPASAAALPGPAAVVAAAASAASAPASGSSPQSRGRGGLGVAPRVAAPAGRVGAGTATGCGQHRRKRPCDAGASRCRCAASATVQAGRWRGCRSARPVGRCGLAQPGLRGPGTAGVPDLHERAMRETGIRQPCGVRRAPCRREAASRRTGQQPKLTGVAPMAPPQVITTVLSTHNRLHDCQTPGQNVK